MVNKFRIRDVGDSDDWLIRELESRDSVQKYIGFLGTSVKSPECMRVIEWEDIPLGIVGLVHAKYFSSKPSLELICALRENFEDRGVATMACTLLLSEPDVVMPPFRLIACVSEQNHRARSLAVRLGFSPTAETRDDQMVLQWNSPSAHM